MYQNDRTLFSLGSGMWLPEQRGLGPEWWLSALASLAHDRPALLPSELLPGLRGQCARRAQLGRPATQAPLVAHETHLTDNPVTIAPTVKLTPTILFCKARTGRLVWACEKQWTQKRTPKSQA